jgi:WD40 repeat protein
VAGYVVVSYHPRDRGYVERLVGHLAAAGIEVWAESPAEYGGQWLTVVRPRIDSCAAFLVVMTPWAEQSSWVDRQVARAIEAGVPIYPLLLVGSWTFKRLHVWNLATRGPLSSPFTRVVDGIMPRPPFMADLLATLGMPDPVGPAPAPPVCLAPARAIEIPPPRVDRTGWDEAMLDVLAPTLNAVAWSPDGQTIAVAGDDGMAYLWDVAAGHVRAGFEHPEEVTALAWSPDSRSLATAGDLGDLRVWDSVAATARFRVATPDSPMCLVAWSPDGESLATGGDGAAAVRIWDAGTGEPRSVLTGRRGFVGPGSWSPMGPLLATTGNRRVWIWDVPAGRLRAELLTGTLWALCWSPDGRRLATVDDDTIGIWEVDAATESAILTSRDSGMRCVAWSADGRHLAVGGCDQTVTIWQPDSPHPVATLDGHTDPIFSLSWSPDSRRLVTAGGDWLALLWDLGTLG